MNLIEEIMEEEGFNGFSYKDTLGFDTIAYGIKLPLDKEEGKLLLEYRLERFKAEVQTELKHLHIEDEAWDILYMMAYQLGTKGLLKFKKMILALENQNYEKAGDEMLLSKWAEQTPNRAKRMSEMMKEI